MHLIVTEKHDAAQRISGILSKGSSSRTSVNDVPVYSWDNGQSKCIGLAGHVVEVDFPDEYEDWNAQLPSALIDADIVTKPSKPDIVNAVKSLATNADTATIATDFDREGELIGKEAHDLMKTANQNISIDRVRFSSITAPEVFDSFDSKGNIDFDLASAAQTRQWIDLLWGASLTRFLTLSANLPGRNVLSVGRVQTPTLAIVVDREREIEDFDPDDYWEIYADFKSDDAETFEGQYYFKKSDGAAEDRITTKSIAESVYNSVKQAETAEIVNLEEETRSDNPPAPFDTTSFIKAANKLDFNAKHAMSIAEDLYTEGYISYPRTENTVYPDDLNPEERVETLSDVEELSDAADRVLSLDSITPTTGDTESTDHPPIHPTDSPPRKSDISGDEWEIYELVSRRFLATVSEAAKWARTTLNLDVNGQLFKANGRRLVEPGYHAVYPYVDADQTSVPGLDPGTEVPVIDTRLEEKQTQPPNRYGQSRLIEEMKKRNLGTKSTRHNTIDKLYNRDYVEGKPLKPTEISRKLISTMKTHANQISSADMTSDLEGQMDEIADGDLEMSTVTSDSREKLREVFDSLKRNEDSITSELSEVDVGSNNDFDPIGECPECGGVLKPVQAGDDSYFVGCEEYPECEFTLPLPNKGRPHILDVVCDEHEYHNVKMLAGSKTSVYGCPQCEKERADEHEDQILGPCPECDDGEVAVKRVRTGSRLAGCTDFPDCDYSVPMPPDGEVKVVEETCVQHQIRQVEIHQGESDNPWELGCPICSFEEYQS